MAQSRDLERECFVIERPSDGNYKLGLADIDRIRQLLWHPETPAARSLLGEAVHAQLWMAAPDLGHSPKLLHTMNKEGWTRPYMHILLDLIEQTLNGDIGRTRNLLSRIFERQTADAFLLAVFNSKICIYNEERDEP